MRISLPIVLSLVALTGGCNAPAVPDATNAQQDKPARPTHRVEVATAVMLASTIERHRTGTLAARRQVRVLAREEGALLEVKVREGTRVDREQVLAQLDDSLLRAQLRKTTALRRQAEQDVARLEQLRPSNLASEDELARARTVLETTRAEEQLLQLRVNRATVSAPLSGIVTERAVEPGDVVSPMTHLFTVADNSSYEVRLPISERLLPLLHTGDSVALHTESLSQPLAGRVARVHPVVDPATRQGIVEVVVDTAPEGLVPGQMVRAVLVGRDQGRLAIPFESLRRDNRGEFVYRLDEAKVVKTPVVSGIHLDGGIEIRSGLSVGDRVVVRGFLGIEDGMTVAVNETAAGN